MAMRSLGICLFVFFLFLSMLLFVFLKVHYATALIYQGQSIRIQRDEFNIPSIDAPSYRAAMFAWGYVTAEDRLFQLTFRQRLGQGRLSEFLGSKALLVDKVFRELNFQGYSDRTADRMRRENESAWQDFQSYADGINAYAASLTFSPVEFYMVGLEWEKWTISDIFTIYKLLKWSQSQNIGDEYIRSHLLKFYSKQQIDLLMPYRFQHWQDGRFAHQTIVKDDEVSEETRNSAVNNDAPRLTPVEVQEMVNMGAVEYLDTHSIRGSNSWVISGEHTESGHPILSNDPHMDSAFPGEWYQIRIRYLAEGKECRIVGGSIVGAPSFLGKTTYISIALTTIYDDIQDLYKEKIEGDNYYFDGQWRPLKTRVEEIRVKDGETVLHTVRETHHGPIISHILHRGYIYQIEDGIALTWAGFTDAEFISLVPYSHIAEVQDWKTLQTVLPRIIDYGPTMNLLYITKDDHIGYTAIGPNVIRRHPYQGMYVKDGTDIQNDWVTFVNGKGKLHLEDPPRGYIVTANNKPAGNVFQHGMYETSMFTARADRIEQLIRDHLSQGLKFNKQKMKQIQRDTVDVYCLQVIDSLSAKLAGGDPKFNELFETLRHFDCNFTSDSQVAPLFLSFYYQMYEELYPSALGREFAISLNFGFLFRIYRFIIEARTEAELGILKTAMGQAWQEMEVFFGTRDVSQFRYGKLHRDRMVHRPFGQVKSLAPLFEGTSEGWGTQNTPNVGLMSKLHSKDYSTYHRANIRTIISYYEDSEWIVDSGTSEKFYSRHYNDQNKLFVQNSYLPMDSPHQTVPSEL